MSTPWEPGVLKHDLVFLLWGAMPLKGTIVSYAVLMKYTTHNENGMEISVYCKWKFALLARSKIWIILYEQIVTRLWHFMRQMNPNKKHESTEFIPSFINWC